MEQRTFSNDPNEINIFCWKMKLIIISSNDFFVWGFGFDGGGWGGARYPPKFQLIIFFIVKLSASGGKKILWVGRILAGDLFFLFKLMSLFSPRISVDYPFLWCGVFRGLLEEYWWNKVKEGRYMRNGSKYIRSTSPNAKWKKKTR